MKTHGILDKVDFFLLQSGFRLVFQGVRAGLSGRSRCLGFSRVWDEPFGHVGYELFRLCLAGFPRLFKSGGFVVFAPKRRVFTPTS